MPSSKTPSNSPHLQVAFQKRMSKHDLDFILDFDGLLSDQVGRFKNHPDKFRDFAKRFARYGLPNPGVSQEEQNGINLELLMEYYNYSCLFFSRDQVGGVNALFEIEGVYVPLEQTFTETLLKLEETGLFRFNHRALIVICTLHLRMQFMAQLSPAFFKHFVKEAQASSKRVKAALGTEKKGTKTHQDKIIQAEIEEGMNGAFGYGVKVWKHMIKGLHITKKSLRVPGLEKLFEQAPLSFKPGIKKGEAYLAMVPLIRLLSPDYKILDLDTWLETNVVEEYYVDQYLKKRVRDFDKGQVLLSRG